MEKREIKVGATYKHFKGKLYKVLYLALDASTEKSVVVYKCLYSNSKSDIWVRDMEEFLSPVDKDKYPESKQYYRFEYVE